MKPWKIYKVILVSTLYGNGINISGPTTVNCFSLNDITKRFSRSSSNDNTSRCTPAESIGSTPSPNPKPGQSQTNNTGVSKVELDIKKNKEATEQYDYEKKDITKTATYTSKKGYCFSSVKLDSTEIWKGKDNESANKVIFQGDNNTNLTVEIYFTGGTKKLFNKGAFGKNKAWTEMKIHSIVLDQSKHPGDVKVTTEGSSSENDSTKYKVSNPMQDYFLYRFNDGVKCTLIRCNDKEVWKRESDTENLDSFTYNKRDNQVTLRFGEENVKLALDTSTGSWIIKSSTFPLQQKYHPGEVKLTTDGSSSENDASKYKVYKKEGIDEYEYTFNQNVNCTKVTYDGNDVWKLGTGSGGSDSPDSLNYNKSAITITLWFGSRSIKYKKNDGSDKWEQVNSQQYIPT